MDKHKNHLTDKTKERIIGKALLSRLVEEKLLELYSENKLFGTIHTCIGEEFSGAVVSEFVKKNLDTVFSNHRCHGHFLSIIDDVYGLFAEIMGKSDGVCGGRGGSQHLCKEGFYSNGIQGGTVPIAVGLALSHKVCKTGGISYVFIGDGTWGEGTVYEALNIASKWELPLVLVVENNYVSQSTMQTETLAGSIKDRINSFNIKFEEGDTWDWENLYYKVEEITDYVRQNSKPAAIQINTYRLKAHSKGDDIRPCDIVEAFEKKDPLNVLLAQKGRILQELDDSISLRVEHEALRAYQSSDAVYSFKETSNSSVSNWQDTKINKNRFIKKINQAFHELLKNNKNILFFGEDVKDPYGGAFKVSKGLSTLYPEQVLNTPISEAALVGIGCGIALGGLTPIVEIMFGDFLTLGFDQILNHATKFNYMYNEQTKFNLIIRTPMGGGRGYGPTHSQTIEKHFLGIPGLRIIALNSLSEPYDIYSKITQNSSGCNLVIENKLLYSRNLSDLEEYEIFRSNEAISTFHIRPKTNKVDITLFCYGGMLDTALSVIDTLFYEHDIVAQIICPTQIYPFSIKEYLGIILNTELLVFIEEGQLFAGLSSEVIAQMAEYDYTCIGKILRVGPDVSPIPTAGKLEKECLPNEEKIIRSIIRRMEQ